MERDIDLNTISDGKKYSSSDMVRIGCNDCKGCYSCCQHMEGLITLDPYDVHRILQYIKAPVLDSLFSENIEFIIDRDLMVPVLKMNNETGCCSFLNKEGRCSIHSARPGICRLFPMGRVYEGSSFYYFLQKDECPYPCKTKVKLKKWLDTPDISKYEKYIMDWHSFICDIRQYVINASEEEKKQINTVLTKMFYLTPYAESFYSDFYDRLNKVNQLM